MGGKDGSWPDWIHAFSNNLAILKESLFKAMIQLIFL